eukprot:4682569-Pyramimonas_sp.AAC.1
MTITDRAEYLGVLLGPSVDDEHRWEKGIPGWQRPAVMIADVGAPTSTSLMLYSQRAVNNTSYLGQLF